MPAPCLTLDRGTTFQSVLPCDLKEVRPAMLATREYLSEEGLQESEVAACELALTEACNNAIQYASDDARRKPIEINVVCCDSKVELSVSDHTKGFQLPTQVKLPDPESESGRGIYLMRKVMDQVSYFRGDEKNTLVLRKARTSKTYQNGTHLPADLKQANRRLVESERLIRNMAKELCFRSESLAAIFRCSAELGHASNVENFSEGLLHDLLDFIFADWFVLRVLRQNGTCLKVLAASEPGLPLEPLDIPADAAETHSVEVKAAVNHKEYCFDSHEPLRLDDPLSAAVGLESHGVARPLLVGQELIGVLTVGKTNPAQPPFTASQLQVVRTFSDYLAIQVVNAKFQEEVVSNRLVSREMEIAKNIQRALLPKSLPQPGHFGLAGFCESAHKVGGDFYDVVSLPDDTLLLIVADVMGKGVPAAMFAAVFAATLRGLVLASPALARQPSLLLSRVNHQMAEELSAVDMFITAQLAYIDFPRRELTAASAGHCPLLVGVAHEPEIVSVSPEGMPLGIMQSITFADETIKLKKNSRVLLYTDGMTESRNPEGQFFSEQRLLDWFKQGLSRDQTAEQLKRDLIRESRRFLSDSTPHDDQTFLILAEETRPHP